MVDFDYYFFPFSPFFFPSSSFSCLCISPCLYLCVSSSLFFPSSSLSISQGHALLSLSLSTVFLHSLVSLLYFYAGIVVFGCGKFDDGLVIVFLCSLVSLLYFDAGIVVFGCGKFDDGLLANKNKGFTHLRSSSFFLHEALIDLGQICLVFCSLQPKGNL
jgi:hypothetical protein